MVLWLAFLEKLYPLRLERLRTGPLRAFEHQTVMEISHVLLPNLDAAFAHPTHVSSGSFWHGHIPFAHFVVARLRPRLIVEFGVEHGDSLFALADAVKWNVVESCRLIGCDTWSGDQHVGDQQDWIFRRVKDLADRYGSWIDLRRMHTLELAPTLDDESVDLLHIDAAHDYDSVAADFNAMMPKLSESGVILFHDIAAFGSGFGVWRLWSELSRRHPHLCLVHSAGLGVLAPHGVPTNMRDLFELSMRDKVALAGLFSILGKNIMREYTPLNHQRSVAAIANLPVPEAIQDDELFCSCLAAHRW